MNAVEPRDEMGSDHHLDLTAVTTGSWLPAEASLVASGRHAIYTAATALLGDRGVLHVPTYFCHDVTRWLERHLPVALFAHGPFESDDDLSIGEDDVALVVEYFGNRSSLTVHGGRVVVDRTHLPWATHVYDRRPDAITSSLRKALPLPDGGVCQFMVGVKDETRGAEADERWESAVSETLLGMELKGQYIRSGGCRKDEFLSRIKSVERHLDATASRLPASDFTRAFARHFDVARIEEKGRLNQELLAQLTSGGSNSISLLNTPSHTVLTFESAADRDAARQAMIAEGVFPAILWDPGTRSVPDRQRRLAETTLFLHVDHRYSDRHIERLASIITAMRRVG